MNSKYFALIGASVYIALQHMKTIKETGNELFAASGFKDLHSSSYEEITYISNHLKIINNKENFIL